MKNFKLVFTVGIITILTASLAAAPPSKAGKTSSNVPVTTTIVDEANGALLLVGSDGHGSYSNTKGVISEMQGGDSGTDFYLKVSWGDRKPARQIYLDFSEPALGTDPAVAPFTSAVLPALIIYKGKDMGQNLLALIEGQSVEGKMLIHFDYGGKNYRIGMNENSQHVTEQYAEYARVTCLATDSSGCVRWQFTPSGEPTATDPNPKNISMLFDKNGDVLLGYFYFSFLLDVVK